MKTAIISSSAIARYGRMDAGFHIAVQEVAGKAAVLETQMSAADAVQKLEALEVADLKLLAPLLRGSRDVGRKDDYLRAAREYPFIAYALVRAGIEDALQRTEAEIATRQGYLDTLRSLQGA